MGGGKGAARRALPAWLTGYRREWLRADLIAGAVVSVGTSRTLIVSATTATSALSAAAVGPLAHGNAAAFAALSAADSRGVLILGGLLGLGAISRFVVEAGA